VTEVRMQPLAGVHQQCHAYQLHVKPLAHIYEYQDSLGNFVHHFSQPGVHSTLHITAFSEVEVQPPPPVPQSLSLAAWGEIDEAVASGEYWEMLEPTEFTARTARLDDLAHELGLLPGPGAGLDLAFARRRDPLSLLFAINSGLHRAFAYDAASTKVDSPIDEALKHRRGVCQDLTHIMLALLRNYLSLPCRYISGYLYHRRDDRSVDGATHAWIQAWLPGLGWVGFDPTNNILQGERHIEVAIGREYPDVPPTRGVYKGNAGSELAVTVRIRTPHEAASPSDQPLAATPLGGSDAAGPAAAGSAAASPGAPALAEPAAPETMEEAMAAFADPDDDLDAAPVYRTTEAALQLRYAQALLAMEMQQQQQQQ
jgi:transglutaminase-like putative cysteine protease